MNTLLGHLGLRYHCIYIGTMSDKSCKKVINNSKYNDDNRILEIAMYTGDVYEYDELWNGQSLVWNDESLWFYQNE